MGKAHILLVEDNEGDIFLITEALQEYKSIKEISIVKNGQDAVDFLFQEGLYQNVAAPDLVLLDINIHQKSGLEVLKIVKTNKKTQHIPVIMLTTSSSESDISLAYKLNACQYIIKPFDADDFEIAMALIEEFVVKQILSLNDDVNELTSKQVNNK